MSVTSTDLSALETHIHAGFARRKLALFGALAAVILYLLYAFFALDIPGLAQRFRPENAMTLLRDSWSYKTHVTLNNRSGDMMVSIDGERNGAYPADRIPDWVTIGPETTEVALTRGARVTMSRESSVISIPGHGAVTVDVASSGISYRASEGFPASWISASANRVDVNAPEGKLSVTKSRSEVFRYFNGWALFFFDLQSPFHYMSWGQIFGSFVSGPQIEPGQSNIAAAVDDFLHNSMWHHAQVFWALFETLLMAFLGTMGAALIGLPLAFLAARNFNRAAPARFGIRRVFDFLRGVDGLIWTIILSRAFGPGPLTGSLAILLTDTGSFGKLFSEALENIDEKQIEGLQSTGANGLQRNRFGVIPQIAPVILSQVLYFLESNTRGATVIGAIVGGGIGLLLTQAMMTQKDWEDVAYYIILVLLLVMAMDSLSGWLRMKLLKKTDNA